MSVNVEVICIGNELLIGKIQNTNAHWLSRQVTKLGAKITRISVIQDLIPEIAQTINEAIKRKPQVVITTGGLGPTFDDKTFQGIARALNRQLRVDQKALEIVKQKCVEYAKKSQHPNEFELTPPRVKMATFPDKTIPISNPIGTAPGLCVEVGDTVLFALPGVPMEMEAIFTESIVPLIKQKVGANIFCEQSIFAYNIMESCLAPIIDSVMIDNQGVYIKSHPMLMKDKPRIELHLTILANRNQKPAEKLLKAAKMLAYLIEENGGIVSFE
jgi:molybdenum cofactor synthesis domain-containing protein